MPVRLCRKHLSCRIGTDEGDSRIYTAESFWFGVVRQGSRISVCGDFFGLPFWSVVF